MIRAAGWRQVFGLMVFLVPSVAAAQRRFRDAHCVRGPATEGCRAALPPHR